DAAHVAIPRIAITRADRHFEGQLIVDRVRPEPAQIVVDAGAAQTRSGNSVFHGQLLFQDADSLGALEEYWILSDYRFVFVDPVRKLLRELLQLGKPTRGRFAHHSANPYVVEHHALPGNRFEQVKQFFPLAERVKGKAEHGAQIDQIGAQPEQVRTDAIHLRNHHAHVLGAGRNLH